jgi:putative membrane protein
MKTRLLTHACLLASVATFNMAFSPLSSAQTTPSAPPVNPAAPDGQQATKTPDSPAEQHSGSAATTSQATTPEDNNSKNATNTLDSNPSMAPTGSGDKSATKSPTPSKEASGKHHNKDKGFAMKAAQGGMLEVELGKVAQDKASASNVKDFGAKMVTDHSAANDKLKAIAEQKGWNVPDKLDAKHQAVVDKLSGMSGAAFDKAYVAEMVKDHESDAAAFQKEADSTQDPDMKTFATDTLETVKMHLHMIKDIQSGMKK